MPNDEKTAMYMTRGGVSYTFDELAEFATYVYGLDDEEARSLVRLSAYMSQRILLHQPTTGEDISEASERIMAFIKRSIEEARRGLLSADKGDANPTAIQEGVMVYDDCTPEAYCVECDSTSGFKPVDLYVCNTCGYEFDDWNDYCPSCDRDCRIEYCIYKCENCGHYIPEVVL